MNKVSEEIIEIDGKEYSLFLNRDGIVAWELYSQREQKKAKERFDELKPYIEKVANNEFNVNDDVDPLKIGEEINSVSNGEQETVELYRILYWIMFSKNHHFKFEEASKLFDKAVEEYGTEQIILLGVQMINDANVDKYGKSKNLPALRQQQK